MRHGVFQTGYVIIFRSLGGASRRHFIAVFSGCRLFFSGGMARECMPPCSRIGQLAIFGVPRGLGACGLCISLPFMSWCVFCRSSNAVAHDRLGRIIEPYVRSGGRICACSGRSSLVG